MNAKDITRNCFRCPNCGVFMSDSRHRMCPLCGYDGDWIQKGHDHLYLCGEYGEHATEDVPYNQGSCTCEKLARRHMLKLRMVT